MTVCSKPEELLAPHRYYKYGRPMVSGLPQDLNIPSLFVNEPNVEYNDYDGRGECVFYEKQKDRGKQTIGLRKTMKWFHLNKGKSVRLVVRNVSGKYDYRSVIPIAFNGTHIILQ